MRRDPTVVLLGEDVGLREGAFGVTKGVFEEFGAERVWDTPISETAIIGFALGAALTGMRPVPEIQYSSFLGCCMDELFNQVSKIRYMSGGQVDVPLVVRTVNVWGFAEAAQHSDRPEAWFMHMPGMKVALPSTPYDAKGMLKAAIRGKDPVLFFEHAMLYYQAKGPVPESDYTVPLGVADTKRKGRDLTIVTYSRMVHEALKAAAVLEQDGIEAEVIDLRTLVPLDEVTMLESVKRSSRLVIVEEDSRTAGVGAEIAATVIEGAFEYLDAPIVRVAAADVPVPFSPAMERFIMPDASEIVRVAHKMVYGSDQLEPRSPADQDWSPTVRSVSNHSN
jgi:pyruvate/2-oxoglutarate/acetoin dehydrogenase E1 component